MTTRRLSIVFGSVAGVVLLVGAVIIFVGQADLAEKDCIQVMVWSSDEKVESLQEIASRYHSSGRKVDQQCVSVKVKSAGSRSTVDALADAARPWDVETKPDLWTPPSSVWIDRLRTSIATKPGRVRTVGDAPSLATTPIVIAMPEPMARVLGWPESTIKWQDLVSLARDPSGWNAKGHPEWGAFKLGKTNPLESTTGLLATTATATALADSGPELGLDGLARPEVVDALRALEGSTVHYGKHVETFVNNVYAAGIDAMDYVSAIALEEKVVLDYNKGIILGDPPRHVDPPTPKLAAFFPADGTMTSDNPALLVDADWVSESKRQAAEDFRHFATEQKQVFLDAGFRDGEGNPGTQHQPSNGTVTHPKYNLVHTPSTEVIDAVHKLWTQIRRRANVVLVVDVSMSMDTTVASGGPTRLKLAQEAAKLVPAHLALDDRLGLWEFSSELGTNPNPWRELVPLGMVNQVAADYTAKVDKLKPLGATALYATTRHVVDEVERQFDPARINAVVILSDGKNEYHPDNDPKRLLGDIKPTDKDRVVRVFTIAYAEDDPELRTVLEDISKTTRARTYDAKDAEQIDDVIRDVLSNF
jgi:Ca-activated chloride channel family protein